MAQVFSQNVKNQLAAAEIRKKCCRHTFADMDPLDKNGADVSRLREIWERCRCDGCRSVFFRKLFLLFGSVTDPSKSYQLDFSFGDADTAAFVRDCLASAGFSFGQSLRRGRTVLWLRESGAIEDILAYMGATSASFDMMNAKIEREFRGNANRQVNFDTANIGKQLRASMKYAEAVNVLKAAGKYDQLPEDVRLTGELRAANEQLSFEELGRLHLPPITKSGVRHRLDKILRAAEECAEGSEKGEA